MTQEDRNSSRNSLKKFQDLLRTLFQVDSADLDFGIYRILNYRRDQVETFITERLSEIVGQTFAKYAAATSEDVAKEAEELKHKIIIDWGSESFNGSGQLKFEIRDKPIGRKYLAVEEKIKVNQVAEELKTRVYNDLYTFFSRYYEDGDFISKRRYGRHETYVIPYNGEEVVLYWANRDQYYVKTGERFKAYRFNVGDYTVAFELRNMAAERNGTGGRKRYAVPAHEAPVTCNEQEKTLAVIFGYRPLTEAEEKEHGRTEQQKPQESLNEAAEKKILEAVADGSLKVALAGTERANGPSLLHKHLTRFTRKNTADFFIHKGLRGFLRRELDFFIKNEVILLDELIDGGEDGLQEHVQRGWVVRQVAEAIIEFLAQVEDFQKKLWEKRKFVLRTEYCLTVDRVPEELWDEVLANEAQFAEWQRIYALDDLMKDKALLNAGLNKEFLRAHPTLMIDTRHFSEGFKWRLLARFDNLDEALDGVLIKSDNWQALNLLLEKYREKVKCIYIDPPFNSGASEILYKNIYKHSSWLAMMENRFAASYEFSAESGVRVIAIDENEQERLGLLLRRIFPRHEMTCVTIVHNPGGIQGENFSYCHEYAYFVYPSDGLYIGRTARDSGNIVSLRDWGGDLSKRETARNCFYPIYVRDGDIIGFGEVCRDDFHPRKANILAPDGIVEVYPVDQHGVERKWRHARQSIERIKDQLLCARDGEEWVIRRLKSTYRYKTVWTDAKYNANTYGSRLLNDILGEKLFDFPKSVYNTADCILAATQGDKKGLVLDYFAGSGTTAHAVINLNRQDGGERKYVMVEMGDWFETVTLPRIKKVVFCERWKDGKPRGGPGISHMLKYQYLEQYEDTLNNLELPRVSEGQEMMKLFGDEYLLKYMLGFETQGSASLLNLDMFKEPFAYRLKVLEGDEIVELPADLVETFNYLLGIQVKKITALEDNGRPYRAVLGERDGKRVVVVWRSVVGLEDNEEAQMKDKGFIEKEVLPALLGEARPDRLLVNGACFAKDVEAIEAEFHRLMFPPVGL